MAEVLDTATISAKEVDRSDATNPVQTNDPNPSVAIEKSEPATERKPKTCHKHKKEKTKTDKKKSHRKSKDTSDSDTDSTDMTSSDDSSSGSDQPLRRRKTKTRHRTKRRQLSFSEDESESDSPDDMPVKKSKRSRHTKIESSDSESVTEEDQPASADDGFADLKQELENLKIKLDAAEARKTKPEKSHRSKSKKEKSKVKKSSTYQRVDHIWDEEIHNYKLKETSNEDHDSEFADYAFVVRRRFTYENEYIATVVDIKAKELKKALAEVMKDCKSISLDVESPSIDPNLLYLFCEDIRQYYQKTLKAQIKAERKKREIKRLEVRRSLCKTLVSYIDKDYAKVKKTLDPLIAAGNITFELSWALFRPNEIIVTSSYGTWTEPRCFKVDYANKLSSFTRGEYLNIEGNYLEYDGKHFGVGDFEVDVDSFKGVRKISSLAAYPLRYHSQEAAIRKQIIERGKRFIALEGMNHRLHNGIAFMKKKKQVLKININGRVMVDPATFRNINPNYPVSVLKPKDLEDLASDCSDCSCSDESESDAVGTQDKLEQRTSDNDEPKIKYKFVKVKKRVIAVPVEVDDDGVPIRAQRVEKLEVKQSFSDEDLLLTSSVVLGFAFSEKLWLEFAVSGIQEIEYNQGAFDSLVLPPAQKSIVKAIVESHKLHSAETIDDVVQGKGRGKILLLHGPPGVGKTLTAESIAELMHAPLYAVSAGELGTDAARLEAELNRVLDCASRWRAVLLLDEADIFMEQRQPQDIHRNSLVSIFLRTLEYYAGLMILTTNRVETFDEAFQSRIHVGLRYENLSAKAKKQVWKMFIEMCKKQDGCQVDEFKEYDFDVLARHNLNGRQIKNLVSTAQALALNESTMLSMTQIKRVLEVSEAFQSDLKGGTGYVEAMRSYT